MLKLFSRKHFTMTQTKCKSLYSNLEVNKLTFIAYIDLFKVKTYYKTKLVGYVV